MFVHRSLISIPGYFISKLETWCWSGGRERGNKLFNSNHGFIIVFSRNSYAELVNAWFLGGRVFCSFGEGVYHGLAGGTAGGLEMTDYEERWHVW